MVVLSRGARLVVDLAFFLGGSAILLNETTLRSIQRVELDTETAEKHAKRFDCKALVVAGWELIFSIFENVGG